MRFVPVALGDAAARPLLAELDADLAQRYGSEEQVHADAAEFLPPHGLFVLVLVDDTVVACGGFRPLRPRIGELKRMYVTPHARGTGLARRVLAHLEAAAQAAGYAHLWLETGTMQPEAMRLYESSGYTPIPGFGQFADSPRSRSYAKPLASSPSSRAPLS